MPPSWFDRGRREIVALYAVLAAAWVGCACWVAPPVIASAHAGRSLAVLNRVFQGRAGHPVEHYLRLWREFSGAVLLAGVLHLAFILSVGRTPRRASRLLIVGSFAFLGLTVLSGPRHDYVADLEIWSAVLRGSDPWWIVPERAAPLNAYGPLFNVLAVLAWVNPLAPKLLFSFTYLLFLAWLTRGRALSVFESFAWVWNPYLWVEIAYFGHWDVLVGVACVAAVHARCRGRDGASGVCLGLGVLLKYLPLSIFPFLVLDGRRFRPRLLLTGGLTIALGLAASVLVWGPATFRPLTLAATRGSTLLSLFRFLRGRFSPLRLVSEGPNVDSWALPCLLAAGSLVWVWCLIRRTEAPTSAVLAVLTTLLFYQVGFTQYDMILLPLLAYRLVRDGGRRARDPFPAVALGVYLGWLALFDLYYAYVGGVIHPGDRGDWVDDVAGLPTFVLRAWLLAALLRSTARSEIPRPGESSS